MGLLGDMSMVPVAKIVYRSSFSRYMPVFTNPRLLALIRKDLWLLIISGKGSPFGRFKFE
jgi:hypothetical protein